MIRASLDFVRLVDSSSRNLVGIVTLRDMVIAAADLAQTPA